MKRSIVAAVVIGLVVIIAGLMVWRFRGSRTETAAPVATEPATTAPAVRSTRAPAASAVYPVSFDEPAKARPSKGARPGTSAYLDLKNGFRDVAFGASETSFNDLVLIDAEQAQQLKTYTRTSDVLSLDGMPLESIEYTFFKGQFFRVTLRWKIEHPESPEFEPRINDLARDCSDLYGHPRQLTRREDGVYFVWRGRKVEIILDGFNRAGLTNVVKKKWDIPPTETGKMTILDLSLRRDADMAAAAGEVQGVKDGF
jgi:hypothetical protein